MLLSRDEHFVPRTGSGFINLGATCYFNATMQALFSCSCLQRYLNSLPEIPPTSLLVHAAKKYATMITQADTLPPNAAADIWQVFVRTISHRTDAFEASRHQCAGETITLFLEQLSNELVALKLPSTDRLFYRGTTSTTRCLSNPQHTTTTTEKDNIIYLVNDPATANIFSPATASIDHKCPTCGSPAYHSSTTTLPEIIICLVKRYDSRTVQPNLIAFPQELTTPPSYTAIATIEHSGHFSGGHYWATAKRRDGWHILNDASTTPTTFATTPQTYIVLYEHFRK